MSLTPEQIEMVIDRASMALAEYCQRFDIHHTITGVSGGLDSAVTLFLSQRAAQKAQQKGFRLQSLGLVLPCHSDPEHTVLGKKVIQACDAELLEVDLSSIFDHVEKGILHPLNEALVDYAEDLPYQYRTAQGNVKARLRMALGTYYVANMVKGLVLSTDNYSEYWMGFWTLHGDVGDFGMIQEIWKGSELVQVAQALGVPQEVIDAAPTDGLSVLPGGDAAQLGAEYPRVDQILQALLEQGFDLNGPLSQLDHLPAVDGAEAELVKKIAQRALFNAFKRNSPVNLTRQDLGLDS